MIPLLPKWNLRPNRPSFYDTDSATILELCATLHATMNSLIEDYNKFVDEMNTAIEEFTAQSAQEQENFEIAMRQEFQDFINVIDLKVAGLNQDFANFKTDVAEDLTKMDARIGGLYTNQVPTTRQIINEAIEAGTLTIIESYNDETESLEMTVTGGV